jgi:choline-glycine betaine transporter
MSKTVSFLNRPLVSQEQAKMLFFLAVFGTAFVLATTLGLTPALATNGEAVVTKISTFCAQWIKPIYLGAIALVVFAVAAQGGIGIIRQTNDQGGELIFKALAGGVIAVAIPGAILLAVAATTTFTC